MRVNALIGSEFVTRRLSNALLAFLYMAEPGILLLATAVLVIWGLLGGGLVMAGGGSLCLLVWWIYVRVKQPGVLP